jgi:hypothetical protein
MNPWARLRTRVKMGLLYEWDLAAEIPFFAPEVACTMRTIAAGELEILHQVCPVDEHRMVPRFRRGDRCYVAWAEGRAALFCWAQTRGWHYLLSAGLWHYIRKGEVWLYHGHTAEWCRGRGVYPFALAHVLRDFQKEGTARKAIGYTTEDNAASRRGIHKVGFSRQRAHYALWIRGVPVPLPGMATLLNCREAVEYAFSVPQAALTVLRRLGE